MKEVEIITANHTVHDKNFVDKKIKRVCAYARVSTDTEEQLTSYSSQISYYTEKIKSNPDWEFVGIYADEGISGTQAKNRTEFLRMIEDAKKGKIDIVIAKSISRFARNTVDTLNYVRLLREYNVNVYFEKENINTLDMDSEMFLTFYSAFAQAESESISMNIKLGYKAKMKRGEACGKADCYGFDWNKETQELEINEEQAEVVRMIFNWYINGKGVFIISKELNELGIKTAKGRKWTHTTVRGLINNEKYVGDLKSQKYFVENPITHKTRVNRGEKDIYVVKNHHDPIITREVWEKACELTEKRKRPMKDGKPTDYTKYSLRYPFSSKIVCGYCGAIFSRKMGRARQDGTKATYWSCQRKQNSRFDCDDSKFIRENVLEEMFVELYNKLNEERTTNNINLFNAIKKMIEEQGYEKDLKKLQEENEKLNGRLSSLVDMKLDKIIDNDTYVSKEKELLIKIDEVNKKIKNYNNEIINKEKQEKRLNKIQEIINNTPRLETFNEDCFKNMVDKIIVGEIDENGNKNPNVIKFILKTGKDYNFLIDNKKSMSFRKENKIICDRIIIIDKGSIIAEGTKEELKELTGIEEKVTVEIAEIDEKHIEEISGLPNVKSINHEANRIEITYAKGKNNFTKLLDYLKKENIYYDKIYSERPTLNDVFLELTGKELRD